MKVRRMKKIQKTKRSPRMDLLPKVRMSSYVMLTICSFCVYSVRTVYI